MRVFLILSFLIASNTFAASPVLFGVRGGAPITSTNIVDSVISRFGASSISRRFEVGPTLGVRLPLGFSLEGDALFRREKLNIGPFNVPSSLNPNSDSWQFPVMMKYTGGRKTFSPVAGAGVTVRHLNNFNAIPGFLFSGSTSANTVGFVGAAGLRLRMGPVDITPELRYTRWGGNNLTQSLLSFLPLSRNEASVLVGVTF
jgi:hypothetical protein